MAKQRPPSIEACKRRSNRVLRLNHVQLIDEDFEWLADCAKGMDVEVRNESANYAQLALQGPNAQRILQPLVDVDLGPIKYYRFVRGKVDGADAIISRTGYTGEVGFELYLSSEKEPSENVWNAVMEAGAEFGQITIAPYNQSATKPPPTNLRIIATGR